MRLKRTIEYLLYVSYGKWLRRHSHTTKNVSKYFSPFSYTELSLIQRAARKGILQIF